MITGFDTVLYSCLFLLPGGIIEGITRAIKPRRKMTAAQELLRWLGYSAVNNAIWCWAILFVWNHLSHDSIVTWIVLLAVVVISSTITGIILGIIHSKDVVRRAANHMRIRVENSIPTAWDYVMSNQREPCFMLVTLTDGTHFYGYYGEDSLASSDNNYRDIYLEYVYDIDESGEWKIAHNKSVLINANQIASIEMIRVED